MASLLDRLYSMPDVTAEQRQANLNRNSQRKATTASWYEPTPTVPSIPKKKSFVDKWESGVDKFLNESKIGKGINRLSSTLGQGFLGREGYNHGVSKGMIEDHRNDSTGSKIADKAIDFGGAIGGMYMSPGGGSTSIGNVGDTVGNAVSKKVIKNVSDKAGKKIAQTALRGTVNGTIGGAIDGAFNEGDLKGIATGAISGAIGGTALMGGSELVGTGLSKLKPKISSSIPDIPVKANTPETVNLPETNINKSGPIPETQLDTPKVEVDRSLVPKNPIEVDPNIKTAESKVKTNSYAKADILQDADVKQIVDEVNGIYNVKTRTESIDMAFKQLGEDYNGVKERIAKNGLQSSEDTISSKLITRELVKEAKTTGDYTELKDWLGTVREKGTELGQTLQAFSEYQKDTPEGVLLKAEKVINAAEEKFLKDNPGKAAMIDKKADKIVTDIAEINNTAIDVVLSDKELDNLLAKRVDNHINPKEVKKQDKFEKNLVDTLYGIAKKTLPEKTKAKTKNDPLTTVAEAISNRNEYQAVWKNAKDVLKKKYGADSAEYKTLESWFDQKAKPIFLEEKLTRSVKTELKNQGVDIRKLVKEHYSSNSKVREDLTKTLVEKAGLTGDDANHLANYINKTMKDITKEAKEKVLAQLVKNKPKSVQKTELERILEITNMGGFQNKNVRDLLLEKEGMPRLNNSDVKFIVDTMGSVQNMPEGRAKDIEFSKVKQLIADKIPPTVMDKALSYQRMNLLLNTKTMTRNVLGNVVMGGLENIKDIPGTMIDKSISKITGQRSTTLPSLSTQVKGMKKGFNEVLQDHKLGINTSASAGKYEIPNSASFKKIKEPHGVKQRVNNILAKGEDLTSTGLRLGDEPFYQGAYQDSIRSQLKLAGTDKVTDEMKEKATQIALEKTFQNESWAADMAKNIQKGLNVIGYKGVGLGNVILPFTKTPGNILDKAVDYSPIGGIKGVVNLITGMNKGTLNQKKVVDQLARGLTGTSLIGLGYTLANSGVLEGQGSDNYDVQALMKQSGKLPYSIKTGDTYSTIDWAQPAVIPLMIGADIAQGKDLSKSLPGLINQAVKVGGNTLFDQSLFTGVSDFFSNASDGNKGIAGAFQESVLNALGQAVPFNSAMKQASQLTDKTTRNTYDENPFKKTVNQTVAKIPGLSKSLPASMDTMGNEKENHNGSKGAKYAFDVLFNPGQTAKFNPTKAEKLALDVYEKTSETSIVPKMVGKKIEYKKGNKKETIQLTGEEKSKMQQIMGQKIEKGYNSISKGMSTENKIKRMEEIQRNAKKDAENAILQSRGISARKK